VGVRHAHVVRAEAYAYAGASSIPLKYGDFTAVFAYEGSRVLREAREALTQHLYITLTVEANHPPHRIAEAIRCGEGQTDKVGYIF